MAERDEGERAQAPLGKYTGEARAAPYPLSRMAPAFDLVDVAREIQQADAMLAVSTGGKLEVIARQIRSLQVEAERLLEGARRDAELHRVRCNFQKQIGKVYHLYRREDGERWFLMFAPDEWSSPCPHVYEGSYRLEADLSFTEIGARDAEGGPG